QIQSVGQLLLVFEPSCQQAEENDKIGEGFVYLGRILGDAEGFYRNHIMIPLVAEGIIQWGARILCKVLLRASKLRQYIFHIRLYCGSEILFLITSFGDGDINIDGNNTVSHQLSTSFLRFISFYFLNRQAEG